MIGVSFTVCCSDFTDFNSALRSYAGSALFSLKYYLVTYQRAKGTDIKKGG